MEECAVDLSTVDVIIAAPPHSGFTTGLAAHLGLDSSQIVAAGDGRIHTAGLIAALHNASALGRLPAGGVALLVTAAAGVTAGAALYRVPRSREGTQEGEIDE